MREEGGGRRKEDDAVKQGVPASRTTINKLVPVEAGIAGTWVVSHCKINIDNAIEGREA